MPHDYEISQISKSFAFVVDAKVDILHKDMKKIMEKLDVILSRQHGNQVRTKHTFHFFPRFSPQVATFEIETLFAIYFHQSNSGTFYDLPKRSGFMFTAKILAMENSSVCLNASSKDSYDLLLFEPNL